MPFIEQLAQQAGQGLLGGALGLALGGINDRRQRKQQQQLQDMQIRGNKEMTDYNYGKQLQMWKDTSYQAQIEQMKLAGVNPALMYGMSGGGGQTVGAGGGAGVSGGAAPSGGREIQDMAGLGIQGGLMEAQRKVLESQANLNNVEATKKAGVDTEMGKVQIGLMKLDKAFYEQTFDARIQELDRRIEKTTQESREIDQRVGITAETREATVNKAQQEALGAALENILIGETTKATTQQIEESKARVQQMGEQIKKWQEEIKQGWEGLSLKEKEVRLNGLMQEVEAVSRTKKIGDLPALSPNQRRQIIRQIDKIARIGEGDYK